MRKQITLSLFLAILITGYTILPASAEYYSMEQIKNIYQAELVNLGISQECYEQGTTMISLNENEELLFSTSGPSCSSLNLYFYSEGEIINITNDQFSSIRSSQLNNLGHVSFLSNSAIYLFDGTSTTLKVDNSMLGTGFLEGHRWGMSMNDLDQIAFIVSYVYNRDYAYTNVFLYEQDSIRNITRTSLYRQHGRVKINNQGKIVFNINWDPCWCGGRNDIFMYNGTSVVNITNLPRANFAGVAAFNNSGNVIYGIWEGIYRDYDSFKYKTYLFDGTQKNEITRSDGSSLRANGVAYNDHGTIVMQDGQNLLLCNGTQCDSSLSTDFPSGTSYKQMSLNNAGKFFATASIPAGSFFSSGKYVGTLQPFEMKSLDVANITEGEASVLWGTEGDSTTLLEYGTTYSLGNVTEDTSLTLTHSVLLAGLEQYTEYYFRASSVDSEGARSVSSTGKFITLDVEAPTTSIETSGVYGNNDWFTSNVEVTLTSEDIHSGVSQIRYSINQGYERIVTGNSASFTLSGEGINSVKFYAVDVSGNKEATESLVIKIDKRAPARPVKIYPRLRQMVSPTEPLTLTASSYSDASPQAGSQWQICRDPNCKVIAYDSFGGAATTHALEDLSRPSNNYWKPMNNFWRVRYQDEAGYWSVWSNPTN